MHTSAVGEGTLTKPPNEPQPETAETPSKAQPETPESETAALVPAITEPEVIEGEVMVIDQPEETTDHTLPKQKPYWLLIPCTILCCFVFLGVSLLLPLFTPTATVTILPVEKTVSITTAVQVHGKQLPALTLIQSASVAATGTRHQNSTRAGGTITFYNGLLSAQTIAAGTVFTGSDGTQVVTDQPAVIPPANPPTEGQVTILAHAINTGSQGNIPAYDINTACCATSVVAKNTEAFTGGQNARDSIVVSIADVDNVATSLKTTLLQSEQGALNAQLTKGEALILPTCTPHVASDHKPGDEAKHLSVTCSGIAYDVHEVDAKAMQLLTLDVATKLGATYVLLGVIQATIAPGKVISPRRGVVSIVVQIAGTWVYHIPPDRRQQLLHLIAGMPRQRALAALLTFPGIAEAHITLKGGNQTLPQDPNAITIRIQYSAV